MIFSNFSALLLFPFISHGLQLTCIHLSKPDTSNDNSQFHVTDFSGPFAWSVIWSMDPLQLAACMAFLNVVHCTLIFMQCCVPFSNISMDITTEAAYIELLVLSLQILCSVPPLPPCVPRFGLLMNFSLPQRINYQGWNVISVLTRNPARFWNLTSM